MRFFHRGSFLSTMILASMLALAGCGGGDGDGPDNGNDNPGNPGNEQPQDPGDNPGNGDDGKDDGGNGDIGDGDDNVGDGGDDDGSPSITLSWTAPGERANGDSMSPSDIGGYYLYYGTESGDYSETVEIEDSNANRYTVDGLEAGDRYFFALSAYDTDGLESDLSEEVDTVVE